MPLQNTKMEPNPPEKDLKNVELDFAHPQKAGFG